MSAATATEPSVRSTSFPRPAAATPALALTSSLPAAPVWCYGLSADPSPGLLPRVLELIAKRGLVPLAVHASRGVERDTLGVTDTLSVDMQVDGLDADVADQIGQCLGQIVGVRHVAMSRR